MSDKIVSSYEVLTGLRFVRRFSRFYCAAPMSVAEHSFFVSSLTGVLCDSLTPVVGLKEDVKYRAMAVGLYHDCDEALTGDIPHDVKRINLAMFDHFEKLENVARGLMVDFVGPIPVADTDLDVALVKMADWVDLLLYSYHERKIGNNTLEIASQRIWKLMHTKLRDKFSHLDSWTNGILGWYDQTLDNLHKDLSDFRGL